MESPARRWSSFRGACPAYLGRLDELREEGSIGGAAPLRQAGSGDSCSRGPVLEVGQGVRAGVGEKEAVGGAGSWGVPGKEGT